MKIFSIYDNKTEIYSKPFYELTIGSAIRVFGDAANDPASAFSKHPADYNLFLLGEFDDNTGEILSQTNQNLGSCLEHIKSDSALMDQLNPTEYQEALKDHPDS